jgi:hypothetical protein
MDSSGTFVPNALNELNVPNAPNLPEKKHLQRLKIYLNFEF